MRLRQRWRGRKRGSLRRRIFLAFSFAIVLSALLATGFAKLLAPREWGPAHHPAWGAGRLLAVRFSYVWPNEAARHQFALETSQALDRSVQLLDFERQPIDEVGPPCRGRAGEIVVRRGPMPVGFIRICHRRRHEQFWGGWLVFGSVVFAMWMAAGWLAFRLAMPVRKVAQTAEAIGAGDLGARVEFRRNVTSEVAQLGESINHMADRIEQQLRDQKALLAGVSHELRTPLARMRLLTELARESPGETKFYDELDEEVDELDDLVGGLLAHSRLEFHRIEPQEVDVRSLCERALLRAGLPLERLAVEGSAGTIKGDPALLQRALANLIGNAESHGQGLKQLFVLGSATQLTIEVSDLGPGLPESEEERIFEPFFHRATNDEAPSTLGLGLSLVKGIADAHGASLQASPNRPQGLRMRLIFVR